jgi:hypothetical protein
MLHRAPCVSASRCRRSARIGTRLTGTRLTGTGNAALAGAPDTADASARPLTASRRHGDDAASV